MKLFCICVLSVFLLAGWAKSVDAQPVTSVSCGTGLACTPNPITTTGSIQAPTAYIRCITSANASACLGDGFDTNDYHTDQFVYAQGYNQPGDAGGGTFANMEISGTACTSRANGGTIVHDDSSPNVYCFQRLDPNWGPKEFGAVGDGATNDHEALKNWLQTNQPHIGDVAVYATESSLSCIANSTTISDTIQGPENLDGANSTPLFEIKAIAPFTDPQLIDAQGHCRISGVAINANSLTDALHVDGYHVTIDGFSMLENGSSYNLACGASGSNGLIVKDTIFTSNYLTTSNLSIPPGSGCGNVKLVGDIFQASAGTNVVFGVSELILADSTIEASDGIGLDLTGAQRVSVTGNNIDSNGRAAVSGSGPGNGTGIKIKNANTISISGNHIEGNGGVDTTTSSQIFFDGINDNVDFSSNSYQTKSLADVTLRPSYVYDAANGTVLTNSHFYESAPPQASGAVYSNRASGLLPQLHVPQVVDSEFSGLILSNDLVVKSQVDITPGQASDSTNVALMQLPQNSSFPTGGCTVDLASPGVGGLDTGSLMTNTSYFYFLISSAFGGSPACIASASPTGPTFPSPSPYVQTVSGSTYSGSVYMYNVSAVAGVAKGQPIAASFIAGGSTTVGAVGTLTTNIAGTIQSDGTTVTVSGTTNIFPGMPVSDMLNFSGCSGAGNQLQNGGFTVGTVMGTSFTIVVGGGPASLTPGADCFTVSGGNTITLNANASATQTGGSATVATGLARMIGSLYTYTNGPATQVIPFTQDNDRFYLNNPVSGISASVSTSTSYPVITGIPTGISVGALGRCIGTGGATTNNILIFTPTTAPASAPAVFPTAPGYSIRTTNSGLSNFATTAFPYRLDTNASAEIAAQANASSTLYCMTDGWVFHRGG